jgi:hypothetical protein
MLAIIPISFLSIGLYIIEMDFFISIISMALTLIIAIVIIYIVTKNTMKINDEIVLNTIYRINEDNITISNNKNGNIIIEKDSIQKIEHYKNNSIGIVMGKLNRKIIYSNCIDNYNEFYERLNALHEIKEYKNKKINILIGILGGILFIALRAMNAIYPHKILGLLSGILIYGLLLIFFCFKFRDKLMGKKLKKIYIIGIIAMTFLLFRTILEYILRK